MRACHNDRTRNNNKKIVLCLVKTIWSLIKLKSVIKVGFYPFRDLSAFNTASLSARYRIRETVDYISVTLTGLNHFSSKRMGFRFPAFLVVFFPSMIAEPYISWLTSACVFDSSHVCHWIERWYSPVSFVRCVAIVQVRASVFRTCTNLDTRRNRNNLCMEPSSEWSRTLALEIHHYNFEINARSTIARREMKKKKMTRRVIRDPRASVCH